MERTKQFGKLSKALAAAQAEMEPVKRNAVNPEFGNAYADFAALRAAVGPILANHQIAITHDVERRDGCWFAIVELTHESNQAMTFRNPIAAEPRQGAHKWEAASTYAHRICLARALAIPIGEDDDGNLAAGRRLQQAQPNQRPAQQQGQQRQKPKELSLEEVQKHADDLRDAFRNCSNQTDLDEVARQAGRHWGKDHPVLRAVADDYRRRMQDLQTEAAAA